MAKPTSIAMATSNLGNTDFVLEMSSSLKSTGYQAGEKPTHKNFNWWMNQASIWAEDYLDVRLESNLPTLLRSSGTATWNGSDLVLSANLDISFRKLNGEQINRIAATTLSFSDGQVLVLNKDKISASPVTLAAGAYASLDSGEYVIIAESSLTEDNIENECLIFRRSGTNLECLVNGLVYPTGATITFGSAATTAASFSGVLSAANGGTGQSSYTIGDLLYASGASALSKLADVATGNALISGGVGVAPSWGKITSSHVSGSTGSGNFVLATSPTLTTPILGTPSSGTLTNCTGLPISTGVSGLGTGVATFLATPSSANLRSAVTDETGSGTLVFATSPTLTTPTLNGGALSGTFSGAPTLSGNLAFTGTPTFRDLKPETTSAYDIGTTSLFFQQAFIETIRFESGSFGGRITASGGEVQIYGNGGSSLVGLAISATSTYPTSDNAEDCGNASFRWDDIYATNSTIQTSDRNEKDEIIQSDLGLNFITSLSPVSYKWKTGRRRHYGLIAQDVQEVLNGKDFAGFTEDLKSKRQGLRYSEFIAPIIKSIQELDQEIQNLKKQNKKGEK